MRNLVLLGTMVCVASFASAVNADLLNLSGSRTNPDITADGIDVNYDYNAAAGNGTFHAYGFADEFVDASGATSTIPSGWFDLYAVLDSSGAPISGTLSITASQTAAMSTRTVYANTMSAPLLTGSLSQFGFDSPPDGRQFDFVFDVSGGALAGQFGDWAGVMLYEDPGVFDGTFTQSFATDGGMNGFADVFGSPPVAVPVPSHAILMVVGLICIGVVCRSRLVLPARADA